MNTIRFRGKVFRCAVCLVLSIMLGVLLLTAVYALPVGRMHANVTRSTQMLYNQGDFFSWSQPQDVTTTLDGYTDAIMVQSAIYLGTGHPLRDAMLHAHVTYPSGELPVASLLRYIFGEYDGDVYTYARYWGGYLLFLKPLLLFFSLYEIRAIDACIQFSLALLVLLQAYRKGGLRLALPIVLMIASLNPITTAMCLQYSSMYLITLTGVLVMLSFETWNKDWGYLVFLFLGIATAFFDFLTYPVAAVGVCLTLQVLLGRKKGSQALTGCIGSGAAWAFGYGGMWSGKWVVGTIITRQNVLSEAIRQAQYRSGSQLEGSEGTGHLGFWEVVSKNLSVYRTPAFILLALCLVAIAVWLLIGKHYTFRVNGSRAALLLLCFLVPFVWYAMVRNHSAVHYWMTHRDLCVAIFALSAFITYSLHAPQEEAHHG